MIHGFTLAHFIMRDPVQREGITVTLLKSISFSTSLPFSTISPSLPTWLIDIIQNWHKSRTRWEGPESGGLSQIMLKDMDFGIFSFKMNTFQGVDKLLKLILL